MNENEKKTLTGVAVVIGLLVWFMGMVGSSCIGRSEANFADKEGPGGRGYSLALMYFGSMSYRHIRLY